MSLGAQVPIGIDPRHVHLTEKDFHILFGDEARPRKLKSVKQPGYFAGWETVKLIGPKGEIPAARLIFPFRPQSQVEVTRTDAIALGIKAPLRKSGDVAGSAPIALVGPAGALELKEGCLVPWRHIHMSVSEAQAYGLKHNDFVKVRAGDGTGREVIFENVWIRATAWYRLEFHLDTDEANAAGLLNANFIDIVEKQEVVKNYAGFPEEFQTPGYENALS